MIGGTGESIHYYEKIKNVATKLSNLSFLGYVPNEKIHNYYERAKVLVNTSLVEGFPNIFLEAWMHSIPVISLNVNPDSIIDKHHLGFHSNSINQMIKDIRFLLDNELCRKELGRNGRKYVIDYHDVIKKTDEYEIIIQNMI